MPTYTSQERPKVSTSNVRNAVLSANATYTGTWESTLGYNVVTVIVSTDAGSADGGIRIEFNTSGSGDAGLSAATTYMLDTYTANAGFVRSFAVQGPFFRLEYVNGAASHVSTPSITCMMDTVYGTVEPACEQTEFGDTAYDAFRRLRVSTTHTLLSVSHLHGKNNLLVDEQLTDQANASSTHYPGKAYVDMSLTGNSTTSAVVRQSRRYCEYQPGKSLLWMGTGVLNAGGSNGANCISRMGLFDGENGVFFEYSQNGADTGRTLKVGKRSKVSGSVVTTTVERTAFNVDQLDGKGQSRLAVDCSKANIYWIDLQWLGVGRVRFGIMREGRLFTCHALQHENAGTEPYMSRATLPVRYEVRSNGTSGSNAGSLRMICSTVSSEAGYEINGTPGAAGRFYDTAVSVTNTKTCVIAVRLKSTHNRCRVTIHGFHLMSTAASDFVYALYHWRQPAADPVTSPSWTSHSDDSAVEYSLGTISDFSGGVVRAHGFMSDHVDVVAGDANDRHIDALAGIDGTSDVIAVMCQRAAGTAAQSIFGSINWTEYIG